MISDNEQTAEVIRLILEFISLEHKPIAVITELLKTVGGSSADITERDDFDKILNAINTSKAEERFIQLLKRG